MSINFYQFHKLLSEYGQNLVQDLIQKFQKEDAALTPEIIKIYIDKFEKIKNTLAEKDINKYSWKELESTIDSRQPKQRIKAGKLDPTVIDANLLYNKDGIRIYIGKDKKSCIRYSNGYNFCIGARGEDSMYNYYRIGKKGLPYFIFNDNLPPRDDRHLLVLFVYDNYALPIPTKYRYSLTRANNEGEDNYEKLIEIIRDYPWVSPIGQFVDDNKKGTLEPDPFEIIEYTFYNALTNKKRLLESSYSGLGKPWSTIKFGVPYDGKLEHFEKRGLRNLFISLKELIFNKDPLTINNFIEQKDNQKIAFIRIYESNKDNSIFSWPRMFCVFCKNSDELLKEIRRIAKNIIKEPSIHGGEWPNVISNLQPSKKNIESLLEPIEKSKNKIYELLSKNKELRDNIPVFISYQDNKPDFRDAIMMPYFLVQINDIREIALDVIGHNKEIVEDLNNIKTKYNK